MLGKSTVIRGAYTLSSYLEGTGTNLRLTINPPYASEHQLNYTLAKPARLRHSTKDFYHLRPAQRIRSAGATLRLWDPNVRPAVSNQWNFTIQQPIGQFHHGSGRLCRPADYAPDGADAVPAEEAASQRSQLSTARILPEIQLCRTKSARSPVRSQTATRAITRCRLFFRSGLTTGCSIQWLTPTPSA